MGFVSANQVTIGYTAASREDALHYLSEQAIELGFLLFHPYTKNFLFVIICLCDFCFKAYAHGFLLLVDNILLMNCCQFVYLGIVLCFNGQFHFFGLFCAGKFRLLLCL